MIEVLRREVQALRAQNPAGTLTAICRQIASHHAWPLKAVAYKVYALGLNKRGAHASRQSDTSSGEGLDPPSSTALRDDRGAPLASGNIDWQVDIDGVPFTWRLDYLPGTFPFSPGWRVRYQDQCYRVSRVRSQALGLVTEEADTYDLLKIGS